jgi:hypothetical protein
VKIRGKEPHVYRESETATIARYIRLLPPVYDKHAQEWRVLGRRDSVVRVGTRATILTYMKGRRDQYVRMDKYADLSDPDLRLVNLRTHYDVREPQLDLPVFSGTAYMCKWYLIGRSDELQGL